MSNLDVAPSTFVIMSGARVVFVKLMKHARVKSASERSGNTNSREHNRKHDSLA
jgi:hypothetical protein